MSSETRHSRVATTSSKPVSILNSGTNGKTEVPIAREVRGASPEFGFDSPAIWGSGNGNSSSNGSSTCNLENNTTSPNTVVSFSMSETERLPHHRYSIVSRPSKPSSRTTSPNGSDEHLPALPNDPELEKNSIVHMPGDFVYFEPKPKQQDPTVVNKALSAKASTKERILPPTGPPLPFTEFFQKQDDKKFHILIGATGSVATIKVPLIIDKLFKIYTPEKVSIQLIVTKPAEHFLRGLKISTHVKIWREEDQFMHVPKIGGLVLHHELKKWADVFLLAPLSANTLAKVANGICDNLITAVLRVWASSTPILVAPAMNTFMYINPMTKRHLKLLQEDAPYITVLKPVEKVLVCGDMGMGGMREWNDIVEILRRKITEIKLAREEATNEEDEEKNPQNEEEDDDDEDDDEDEDDEDDEDEDEDEDEDDEDEIAEAPSDTERTIKQG